MGLTLDYCRDEGAMAFANGATLNSCPYRREDRCAAWESGWRNEEARMKVLAEPPMTIEQKRDGSKRLAEVRAKLWPNKVGGR